MIEKDKLLFIHPSEPKEAKEFAAMMPDHQQYIIRSVKLISKLCQGGNKDVIEKLKEKKFVDLDICFKVLETFKDMEGFQDNYISSDSKKMDITVKERNSKERDTLINSALLCKQFVSLLTSAFADVDSPRFLENPLVRIT